MWQLIDGQKANIGIVLGTILTILIEINVVEWDEPLVKIVATIIAGWTGVAISLKGNKVVDAVRKNGGQ